MVFFYRYNVNDLCTFCELSGNGFDSTEISEDLIENNLKYLCHMKKKAAPRRVRLRKAVDQRAVMKARIPKMMQMMPMVLLAFTSASV